MKKKGIKLFSILICTMVFICNISFVKAEETSSYAYSDSATSNGVTLKVEWNEPVLGEPTTFHVSATGGSGIYKFNMEAPSYTNPDELAYESVADPSRGEWTKYTSECESQDYTFTMMATGTYNFRFHVMDTKAGVTYLRTNTYIQVSSPNYPSVNSIVQNAVAKCNSETNGSNYSKALWLHDWLLEQLDYDNSLKWSSAESALTRSSGTCQAYERAYAKLLSAAGIENAETRDTYDGHTWNAMKLDGKWYQVDCTWDDSSENYYNFNRTHLYFALSDELMAIAHQGHNKIYTVEGYATPSNSLEHNYFVQNGDAQQWVESYRNRIQENLNNKNTEFSIQADNSTYPPSIYGIQNGIIAYVMNQNEWFVNGKKVELAAKTNDKQFDFIVTYPVECTNHDWDEGVITTEPTCTTKGVKTFTCNNCKTTKTEEVKALGHDYSKDWTIDKKATCTEEGSKSHHCTRCDSKSDITSISKKEHEWDNGTVTKESTNKETGIKTYKCKNCNDTKTEVIPVKKDESNVHSEAPVIDMSTLKLSSNRVVVGDKVQIALKVTDNVEVSKVLISFRNSETSKLNNIELKFNDKSNLYEGIFSVTEDISSGSWYIYDIEAYDAAGNQNLKLLDEKDYSIIVDNPNLDSEAPVIYKDTVKFNQGTATTGDSVMLSVKIIDNVEIKKAQIEKDEKENVELEKQIEDTKKQIEEIKSQVSNSGENIEKLKKDRIAKNEKLTKKEDEQTDEFKVIEDLKAQVTKLEVKKTKIEEDITEIINKMWEEYELTPNNAGNYSMPENVQLTQRKVNNLRTDIRELGSVNVDSIEEYKNLKQRYDFMCEQRLDLESTMAKLNKVIAEMLDVMKTQFKEKFEIINKNFGEVFKELFGGGMAEVSLTDENNILESGIEINVQPPGKKLQSMTLLSGGERAFTAIALLFAILKINPAPFCVLDEIEAALDDVNVYRYAEYLKKFAKDTQFLIITHRKGTMEAADTIYGVTMEEKGISKLLSMKLKET